MAETDLAWAAGFIDGEGCVYIARAKHRQYINYQLGLRVTQRVREPLDRLSEIFGGFTGSFQATSYARNQQWIWGCSNRTAADVLMALLPYLIVKRKQAQLALAFQEMRPKKPPIDAATGRFTTLDKAVYEDFYWKMRELKKVV